MVKTSKVEVKMRTSKHKEHQYFVESSLTNILSIHENRLAHKDLKRIMVLDDSTDCLDAIRVMLKDLSHLQIETQNEPDLVILDMNLGRLNGIEVASLFNKLSIFNIPVIFISYDGKVRKEIEVRLGKEITFMEKPISGKTLINSIDHILKVNKGGAYA
jgi:DNA-binding NtrC family response regulator